jgi:hypothetical protein
MKVPGKSNVRSCTDWLNENERNWEAVFEGPSASCPSPIAPVPWGREPDGCVAATGMSVQPRRHGSRVKGVSTCPLRPPSSRANHPLPGRAAALGNLPRAGGRRRLGQARSAAHSESGTRSLCRMWHPRPRWRPFPVAGQRTFQRRPSADQSRPEGNLRPSATRPLRSVKRRAPSGCNGSSPTPTAPSDSPHPVR